MAQDIDKEYDLPAMTVNAGIITGDKFENIPCNEVIPHEVTIEEVREKIVALENAIIDLDLGDEADPAQHYFAPGVYCRQLFIPEDQLIVGKLHRFGHINIISHGTIDVVTEFGIARYVGPVTFTSEPGTKRVVHAITDTLWTCIHPTDETDLERIEEEVIAKTYNDLQLESGG